MAVAAPERVLPPAVLGRVRGGGVEPRSVRGVSRTGPDPLGVGLPPPRVPPRDRRRAPRRTRWPRRAGAAACAGPQRGRRLQAAAVTDDALVFERPLALPRMRPAPHAPPVDTLPAPAADGL